MWTRKKTLRALTTILAFGRGHRRVLAVGAFATVAVVALRLTMPWMLRGIVEIVFPGGEDDSFLVRHLPSAGDPVIWLAVGYLLVTFLVGVSEFVQRVNIKRFAVGTVHDLRAAAVRGATWQVSRRGKGSGDLIARIIGDSARIKAGLSGILVHVFQNGLIFVGVCTVLFFVSWKLATIFLLGGLAAIFVGLRTASPVAATSRKLRRKEGKYAVWIQEKLDHGGVDDEYDDLEDADEINESSARKDVKTTRLIARSTLFSHVVLAAAIGVALWVGAADVRSGALAPGAFFIFVAYVLTVHRRTVHIGRQAARAGKVLANANRLAHLLEGGADSEEEQRDRVVTLSESLTLRNVRLFVGRGEGQRTRLRKTAISIEPGSKIAVLGDSASGKSSLLQILAGVASPAEGKILWDGEKLQADLGELFARVAYLPQEPVFQRVPVWRVIGLPNAEKPESQPKKTLRRIGAWDVIRSFPQRFEQDVSSLRLARNEARTLSLAGILLADSSPLWILDSPLEGLTRDNARRRLIEVIARSEGHTLVVALQRAIVLSRFDRVLLLERGRIVFDGTPSEWNERKASLGAPEEAAAERQGNE